MSDEHTPSESAIEICAKAFEATKCDEYLVQGDYSMLEPAIAAAGRIPPADFAALEARWAVIVSLAPNATKRSS